MKCGSCGSLIAKTESVVTRDSFRQALHRLRQESAALKVVQCGGARYHLIETLGVGEISKAYLALRVASLPLLATIKLSSSPLAAAKFSREAQALQNIQMLDPNGVGAYFSRLYPEVIAHGSSKENEGQHALVLVHSSGYWGSLATLNERFATGLDPRHAVWIWRRTLEALSFIHRHGWSHGAIRPEHALVHPQKHAIRLVGWSSARNKATATDKATDLCRSARVTQVLLSGADSAGAVPGSVPTGLAQLIEKAGGDDDFCRSQGAEGLDALLQAEARTAFGPPSFVPLTI